MNISDWLVRNASREPGGAAIHFEGRTITHGELLSRVEAFASALSSMGVGAGDRVGLFLANCPEFLIARWAAIRLGATAAPMNIMFQAREAQYVLNNATPRVLVTESSQLALVEQIWPECPHLQHLVVTDAEIHGAHSFAALERDFAHPIQVGSRVVVPWRNRAEVGVVVATDVAPVEGVKYKAISTGYGSHGFPQQDGVILLDLKRMNRIIEIDAKNKFAVVEPYVVWAQLEAEALKRGLFTTPVQAGSQASVLANVTSGWGMNVMGNHGGHNGRNCLGVEWILPTGELLRLGPEDAWFCGDGPGPSLRGIMRGHCGAQGGMGVFTKVGIKLHHWPGPPGHHIARSTMMGTLFVEVMVVDTAVSASRGSS